MDPGLYFNSPDFESIQQGEKFSKHTAGYFIQADTLKGLSGKKGEIRVALIGVPLETTSCNKGTALAPAAIRKQLYGLANFNGFRGVIDLGDLKAGKTVQDTHYALRDVVEYLSEAGVITVVLGGGQDLSIGIARAFTGMKDFTMAVADPRIDVKLGREVTGASNFITRILSENDRLFHLQFLALQSHLVSPRVTDWVRKQTFDYLQLGKMRDDFTVLEPLLRNASFLSFDISAVRHSDAPGHYRPSPNGLFGEEACIIARYAGLSSRMKVFGLFEVNPLYDKSEMSAQLAAQMVWYFVEGVAHRRTEEPTTEKSLFTRYFVEMEDHGEPMVFYHHPATNRWWIEIFWQEGESLIAPCRENDYLLAVKQEIPDIWWKFARKTDRLSKY